MSSKRSSPHSVDFGLSSERLKQLLNYSYKGEKFEGVCISGSNDYASCVARKEELGKRQSEDYEKFVGGDLDILKEKGFEIQNGKLVRSLSEDDKKRLDSCYLDPKSCTDLLTKEFDVNFDEIDRGVVTLSKVISNGKIGGKDHTGYISGTQTETRVIHLSKINPVGAPKGKDLFDVWEESDWEDLTAQNKSVNDGFYGSKDGTIEGSFSKDQKRVSESVAIIRDIENKNEKRFQAAKAAQEAKDSLFKNLIMAYLTGGGMAGVKNFIKSEIESKINTGLAEAFVRVTGGSEEQIAMLADAFSFMRGKVQERKIKKDANHISIKNPLQSLERLAAKTITTTVARVDAMTGGLGSSLKSMVMAPVMGVANAIMGPKAYEAKMAKINAPKRNLSAIKANEASLVQRHTTTAIASATGLPADVVGQLVSDYKGAQAAKKQRKILAANPIANIGSQVLGVVGGIVKTAGNAFGIMDRDLQKFMADSNELLFAGDVGGTFSWLQQQSLAYANQMYGMKAQGTSFSNGQPKDLEGFVDQEIRKAAISNMARDFGWDEDITNAVVRGEWARQDQKKADHKTRTEAARSTAITAITTIATFGAGAAFGPAVQGAMATVGKAVGASVKMAAQIGAQVVKTAVQVIDGSRNGAKGMLAGLANGALGALTIGGFGGFDAGFTAQASNFLQNTGLGLGISYDRNQGWGGMLGVGGSDGNVSVSFSEHGDTSISGGFAINQIGANLSASYNLDQGSHNVSVSKKIGDNMRVGVSHNSQTGASVTGGYDLTVGGGYPSLGLNFSVGQHGLTTSANIGGISLGSSGSNGYQAGSQDWMGENISQAQANVQVEMNERLEKAKDKMINDPNSRDDRDEALKKLGLEGIDLADLTSEQRDDLIHEMAQIQNSNDELKNREGVDTSRGNIFSQIGGGLLDGVQNIYNFYNGGSVSSHQLLVDSGGNIHPRTCFTAGTKIHTEIGLKNIEDVKVGDVVLSWNEKTGEREYKTVTELFLHEVGLLYEV